MYDAVSSQNGTGLGVIAKQSIYETSTTAKHSLGDKLCVGNRIFRYACNNTDAALSVGKMTSSPTLTSGHGSLVVYAAAAIGAKKVTVTLATTAATLNQYTNGWAWVTAGTGIGQVYKVKSHLPQTSATGNLVLNLFDPLVVALDTTSYIGLYPNPWNGVKIFPASSPVGMPAGVPLVAVPQSTSTVTYYFWAQTRGMCSCYMTTTSGTVGQSFGVSGTAGHGLVAAAYTTPIWGQIVSVAATTNAPALVFLCID